MRIGPHLGPLLLLGVGSLQILGYLARWPGLRGVGFATAASPLPLDRPQARIYEAQRNLLRNPSPDSLLREIALTLL